MKQFTLEHTGNYKPNILVDYPTLSQDIQQANLHQLNLKRGINCNKQIDENKCQVLLDCRDKIHKKILSIINDKELDNVKKSQMLMKVFDDDKSQNGVIIIISILKEIRLLNIKIENGIELLNLLDFCRNDSISFMESINQLLTSHSSYVYNEEQSEITCQLLAALYKISCGNKYCL